MAQYINMRSFMRVLFDDERTADKAAEIGEAILAARSIRLTEIARHLRGSSDAGYKRIQRFLKQCDPRQGLWRLFREQAEFVIADPTEIKRPQARRTEYVGTLKDGKTKGFWALLLATPFRGRAIPCGVVTYSSKTIAMGEDSRNLNHFRALGQLKDLLGERPLVLDREFSYLELLLRLVEEQLNFVIRLNLGRQPPKFYHSDGREVPLMVGRGETVIHSQVWYQGQVCVNLIGVWRKGFSQPLWIMTSLEATEGQRIYFARMKIEEAFRDLKSVLGMTRLMNKRQLNMEKMLALLVLVYAIAMLVGECLRDYLYAEPLGEREPLAENEHIAVSVQPNKGKKWKRYSGLFVLLKQKWSISTGDRRALVGTALALFLTIVQCPVPTQV
jgi:Transposase DDE domain